MAKGRRHISEEVNLEIRILRKYWKGAICKGNHLETIRFMKPKKLNLPFVISLILPLNQGNWIWVHPGPLLRENFPAIWSALDDLKIKFLQMHSLYEILVERIFPTKKDKIPMSECPKNTSARISWWTAGPCWIRLCCLTPFLATRPISWHRFWSGKYFWNNHICKTKFSSKNYLSF